MQRCGRTHGQRSPFDRRCIRRVRVRFLNFFSWTYPRLHFVIVFKCFVSLEKAVLSPILTTSFLPVTVEQASRRDRTECQTRLPGTHFFSLFSRLGFHGSRRSRTLEYLTSYSNISKRIEALLKTLIIAINPNLY